MNKKYYINLNCMAMKVTLSRLTTKDLATLAKRTINSSKNGQHKVAENTPLLAELERIYTIYDRVYTKQTFSGKGKTVATAHKERIQVFTNLKNFLFGYHQIEIVPNDGIFYRRCRRRIYRLCYNHHNSSRSHYDSDFYICV